MLPVDAESAWAQAKFDHFYFFMEINKLILIFILKAIVCNSQNNCKKNKIGRLALPGFKAA